MSPWLELKIMVSGNIVGVFQSIQGEGIFVGEPQLFIRLAECNLECDYCDTKKQGIGNRGKVLGEGIKNPVPAEKLAKIIKNKILLGRNHYHSASLTGGEPLLQVDFLRELIPKIKEMGLKIYLETNGTLPENLAKLIKLIDYISMDIKLPSACGESYWTEHRKSLAIISRYLPDSSFVKIVLTNKTTDAEIRKSISLIKNACPRLPLVLHPVTPIRNIKLPAKEKILAWQQEACRYLKDVRVIPQLHKVLRIK